jgi:asparagine synthase (glutamine-hydrolysing)
MCGINGVVGFNQDKKQIANKVFQMNNDIIHRGPDDSGVHLEDTLHYSLGMGMRRLSIIDLISGNQPMYSDNQRIVICFNGEIYNFKALKNKLIEQGISFKTNSDTEVVLRLYEKEGISSFKKFDGMFAFSIFDKHLNKLFIVRDFFGEKPLYYYKDNNLFTWASELKSLKNNNLFIPIISSFSLNLFFKLSYIPAPYSIYQDVYKLLPGHFLELDLHSRDLIINSYKTESYNQNYFKDLSFDAAISKTRELVFDSVKSRAISDVSVGSFLSGGVDSSIVSLCLSKIIQKPIDTFSIGFKNKLFDESAKSDLVAKLIKSKHHKFILEEEDLLESISTIITNFDEPFADSSALPSYYVANMASKHVKVVLTGDGGDEVFGGYNKYLITKANKYYTNFVPKIVHKSMTKLLHSFLKDDKDNRGLRFQVDKLLNSIDYEGNHYWNIISLAFCEKDRKKLLYNFTTSKELINYYKEVLNLGPGNSLNEMRKVDRFLSLEGDLLTKVDRTSMLNSIECRSPFLNYELWNFTNSLPEKYLINGSEKKWLLRKAFENEFPPNFLDAKKHGFGIPVGNWLRTHFKSDIFKYSTKSLIKDQGIFNYEYLANLLEAHISGKRDYTFQVWSFFCFQEWYFKSHMK